jgi:hypothetical protein
MISVVLNPLREWDDPDLAAIAAYYIGTYDLIWLIVATLDENVRLNGIYKLQRSILIKYHNGVHEAKSCQYRSSGQLFINRATIAFEPGHRSIRVETDYHIVAE